ncbi:ATP-binding protein [Prosthecomicrobium sp. N25]|uniref:ATP-binding protein n=1 Tax=Prosthecomicrobium sp. N25 TaxID=3129254 RepID=UPI0030779A80
MTARTVPQRLWPRGLAGRLVLLLTVALAAAQAAFALAMWGQQDVLVAELARGQALRETVALARLLRRYPPADGEALAEAFGSRQSCARLTSGPAPPGEPMSAAESELARTLGAMLHGVGAGDPQVSIEPVGASRNPCEGLGPVRRRPPGDEASGAARPPAEPPGVPGRARVAAVALSVPLGDGRGLTVRTTVDVPARWTWATFLSFVLSSLAVAGVVVVAVAVQTRSLRTLADASDRLGRGEAVAPLDPRGPREVQAAIEAFNTMQARLGQFLQDRLRLLAGISHDLRTPLTTLRLKAEFVEDEAVRDDLVKTIEELAAICEATLAFTRAEAAAEETQTIDMASLLAEVVEPFRLAGAPVSLDAPGPAPLACRPVALRRALRNLVDNALRYGKTARIRLERAPDGAVSVTVEDDGPGLPEDRIEDAFQPFVRLDASRNPETGGIGLGLAIARSIVRAHGGSLTLANRPAGGLAAVVRLPSPSGAGEGRGS